MRATLKDIAEEVGLSVSSVSRVLNNTGRISVEKRKAVLDALIEQLGEVEEDNLHNFCVSRLEVFLNEREVKTPYVGVLIWYLKSMIQALEA